MEANTEFDVSDWDWKEEGMYFMDTPVTVNSSNCGNIKRNCDPEALSPKLPTIFP